MCWALKGIWILAIAASFVAGSLVTGAIAFADDDDDDLSQLACEAGKVMTGILFEDDDEILDVICDGAGLEAQSCAIGEFVTGFDQNGNILCAPVEIDCSAIGPGANLQGCDLTGASLSGANLSGANLSGAIIQNTLLDFTNFDGANLSGTDFSGSSLSFTASFIGAFADPPCIGIPICATLPTS